jgi:hypothetical protein
MTGSIVSNPHAKYLEAHAEPEAFIAKPLGRSFGHLLTIPAYGEGTEALNAVASVPKGPLGAVLVILVVNGREDSPPAIREANQETLREMRVRYGEGQAIADGALLFDHPQGATLVIDRASPGRELPPRQGVGLARKIGADLALALIADGSIVSPWIHCTDADALLPTDYFAAFEHGDKTAAVVYPFQHTADPIHPNSRHGLEYEISLRYYVAGLKSAGSPYAFHTVGSTLTIRDIAYSQVRGFPKRMAAEDFYILNKLAKVGSVHGISGEPITLSPRSSARVPFGTGRAMLQAQERQAKSEAFCIYDPDVFFYLGAWERTLEALAKSGDANALESLFAGEAAAGPNLDASWLRSILIELGAWEAARIGAERRRDPAARARHLHEGFDAARTLKLIHSLRDQRLSSPPLTEALARAPFLAWKPADGLSAAGSAFLAVESASARPRL